MPASCTAPTTDGFRKQFREKIKIINMEKSSGHTTMQTQMLPLVRGSER